MNNKNNFIHLFTPIKEGLPERNLSVLVITNHNRIDFAFINEEENWIQMDSDPLYLTVTHWLDLSKLTTKNRAIDFAKEAFKAGIYAELRYSKEQHATEFNNFINEKQKEL